MPTLYLAPRGQAKTWELLRYAINLALGAKECVIFVPFDRQKKILLDKLKSMIGPGSQLVMRKILIDVGVENAKNVPANHVRLFDEFDLLFKETSVDFEIRSTDQFYGTPLHQRNLADLKEDDILIKILNATNGHFCGRMWPLSIDGAIFKNLKTQIPSEQLQSDIGNFWKIE